MSRTHVLVVISAVFLVAYVLDLVRRRRLREEYSFLWLVLAVMTLLIAVWPGLASWLARLLGSQNPLSALIFPALYLLLLILIQLSTRLTRLSAQSKNLAQMVGLLDNEVRALLGSQDVDVEDGGTAKGPGNG